MIALLMTLGDCFASCVSTNVLKVSNEFLKSMDAESIANARELINSSGQQENVKERLERNRFKALEILKAIRKDINPKEPYYNFDLYLGRERHENSIRHFF